MWTVYDVLSRIHILAILISIPFGCILLKLGIDMHWSPGYLSMEWLQDSNSNSINGPHCICLLRKFWYWSNSEKLIWIVQKNSFDGCQITKISTYDELRCINNTIAKKLCNQKIFMNKKIWVHNTKQIVKCTHNPFCANISTLSKCRILLRNHSVRASSIHLAHGLRTPRDEVAFTALPLPNF